MDLQLNEEGPTSRKRWLHLAAGSLLALLVIFTLLSNTLYSMTLPKVVTQPANPGQLDRTFKGSGVMKPAVVKELSGQAGWDVAMVLVKAGDRVSQGQALVQYENKAALNQLQAEKAALTKLQLSIEKLEYDYIQAEHGEDKGVILAAKAAMEGAKLDIGLQQQQIQDMQAKLEANQVLLAPFEGLVTEVSAQEGLPTNVGAPDVRLANARSGYKLDMSVPAAFADVLSIGAKVDVQLPASNNRVLPGTVTSLDGAGVGAGAGAVAGSGADMDYAVPPAETYRLSLLFQDTSLVGGERAEVTIKKKGKAGTLLISKSAVRSDPAGTYVFTVEERKGPLGNAFHAVRRAVSIIDSDEHTAAIEGLFGQEAVISESSVPLMDGSRVRILNP